MEIVEKIKQNLKRISDATNEFALKHGICLKERLICLNDKPCEYKSRCGTWTS